MTKQKWIVVHECESGHMAAIVVEKFVYIHPGQGE